MILAFIAAIGAMIYGAVWLCMDTEIHASQNRALNIVAISADMQTKGVDVIGGETDVYVVLWKMRRDGEADPEKDTFWWRITDRELADAAKRITIQNGKLVYTKPEEK